MNHHHNTRITGWAGTTGIHMVMVGTRMHTTMDTTMGPLRGNVMGGHRPLGTTNTVKG